MQGEEDMVCAKLLDEGEEDIVCAKWLDVRWGGYGLRKVIRCTVRRIWFEQSD